MTDKNKSTGISILNDEETHSSSNQQNHQDYKQEEPQYTYQQESAGPNQADPQAELKRRIVQIYTNGLSSNGLTDAWVYNLATTVNNGIPATDITNAISEAGFLKQPDEYR